MQTTVFRAMSCLAGLIMSQSLITSAAAQTAGEIEQLARNMTESEKAALVRPAPAARFSSMAFFESVTAIADTSTLLYPLPNDRTPHDADNTNDGGWLLVDFCTAGATGSGAAQSPDCHHNDDDSAFYALGFEFTFYGDTFFDVYINNNGNISFGNLFSNFTATGFPEADYPMVAPFWGDVDTGDQDDPLDKPGHVWFKFIGSNTLAVTWDDVGYFNEQDDLKNTFQVAISDGNNADMGLGNNICFSYGDMQWTTGDASSGSGGFGGTPATVGANRGDGVDFFQIGRFDHEGTDYDGPGGFADGVSFLDGQQSCFNASGVNIPPIPQNLPPGNQAVAECKVPFNLDVQFISPETDQTTSISVVDTDDAQGAGLVITTTDGNPANLNLNWLTDRSNVGTYNLSVTADDGEDTVTEDLTIVVECPNEPPDTSGAVASPSCLWPPNHVFVDIGIEGVTDADDDPISISVTSITSDEPTASDKGSGGAQHAPDAAISEGAASVRAERSGQGDGRVYTINFIADDETDQTEGSVTVAVPHDQKSRACPATDTGQAFDATGIN
jgi:hypothetical protein